MNVDEMAGHLIRRLHQTSAHVFAVRTKEAGLDVTPIQFAAMDAIRAEPGIDQAGVAAKIAYDRATIGGVIDRLAQKGWISRTVSKRDRRARVLALTEDGAAMFDRVKPVVVDLQSDILPGLSADEQLQFLHLARKATATDTDN
ncbi:MAG: MarR family transcriptional regulator [Rhodobacteraceae bacterium]|nr:MarR family transcriptional regulator [Paracoccaceae bacterium]